MVFNLYPLDDEHAGVAADYYNLLIYQPPPTVPVLVLSVMGWSWLGRGGKERRAGWLRNLISEMTTKEKTEHFIKHCQDFAEVWRQY